MIGITPLPSRATASARAAGDPVRRCTSLPELRVPLAELGNASLPFLTQTTEATSFKPPSPRTERHLSDCARLAQLPAHREVRRDASGTPCAVPERSAEHLLRQQHGLDVGKDGLADLLRHAGLHPIPARITHAGQLAASLLQLAPRDVAGPLPTPLCLQVAADLEDDLQASHALSDPWRQFDLDLKRNPYTLNGSPEDRLAAFQQAAAPLPPAQQAFMRQAQQALLNRVEARIAPGDGVHPGGAMLRSATNRQDGPAPDTRFHVDVRSRQGAEGPRDTIRIGVRHHRPLAHANPLRGDHLLLPEQRVLATDSRLDVTLIARCTPQGRVTVSGQQALRIAYPEPAPSPPSPFPHLVARGTRLAQTTLDDLTATLIDLHLMACQPEPHALARYLAEGQDATDTSRLEQLMGQVRILDAVAGGTTALPADLVRFTLQEISAWAVHARHANDADTISRLKELLMPTPDRPATLLERFPGTGHWQAARQAYCALLWVLLYRNPDLSGGALQLDKVPRRTERLKLLARGADREWPSLSALLPKAGPMFWSTTHVVRPPACAYRHADARDYVDIALRCLNRLREAPGPHDA